jgi:hypothetical protein
MLLILTLKTVRKHSGCGFFIFISRATASNEHFVLNVLLVCDLKKTISSTNFKYDG